MIQTRVFILVFVKLLKLYPIQFRSEYEEEMQTVFAAKVMDRVGEGLAILTIACLREYFDLLHNLFDEYLTEFGKGGDMSHKGRIIFILSGCLFLVGGIFPWASVVTGSTVESFKGANETLLYLTGGIILVAGPGLFLTLGASILSVSYGLFQLSSFIKHTNSLTIFPN